MYMKSVNHIPSPSSLLFTLSPLMRTPPHTHCTYFIVLSLLIPKSMFEGFLYVSLLWVFFTLVSSTPSIILPYPFLPTPIIQQLFFLNSHVLCSDTHITLSSTRWWQTVHHATTHSFTECSSCVSCHLGSSRSSHSFSACVVLPSLDALQPYNTTWNTQASSYLGLLHSLLQQASSYTQCSTQRYFYRGHT
jgi:hypothetical protein